MCVEAYAVPGPAQVRPVRELLAADHRTHQHRPKMAAAFDEQLLECGVVPKIGGRVSRPAINPGGSDFGIDANGRIEAQVRANEAASIAFRIATALRHAGIVVGVVTQP